MKRHSMISSLFMTMLTVNAWSATPVTRQRLLMDENWKFMQSDTTGVQKQDFYDTKWRTHTLPHDWSIEGEHFLTIKADLLQHQRELEQRASQCSNKGKHSRHFFSVVSNEPRPQQDARWKLLD